MSILLIVWGLAGPKLRHVPLQPRERLPLEQRVCPGSHALPLVSRRGSSTPPRPRRAQSSCPSLPSRLGSTSRSPSTWIRSMPMPTTILGYAFRSLSHAELEHPSSVVLTVVPLTMSRRKGTLRRLGRCTRRLCAWIKIWAKQKRRSCPWRRTTSISYLPRPGVQHCGVIARRRSEGWMKPTVMADGETRVGCWG